MCFKYNGITMPIFFPSVTAVLLTMCSVNIQATVLYGDGFNTFSYDETTGLRTGFDISGSRHNEIEFKGSNTLYLAGDNEIHEYDYSSGSYVRRIYTGIALNDMEFMGNDMIIANDQVINRYNSDGAFLSGFYTGLGIIDIEILPNGELLYTDGSLIRRVNGLTGEVLSEVNMHPFLPNNAFDIIDIEILDATTLLVAEQRDGVIEKFNIETLNFIGGFGLGSRIFDMEILNNGELFVSGAGGTGIVADLETETALRYMDMNAYGDVEVVPEVAAVPLPASMWLFLSGLTGFVISGVNRRSSKWKSGGDD